MCPLTFVGLGLRGVESLTLEGLDTIKVADVVYLEVYTNPLSESSIDNIQRFLNREVKVVKREFVEDGRAIIDQAKIYNVVLISMGDPMIATTHMDLRVRAEMNGVKTRVIHNSSILTALPGETGLHTYKFGKVVTMTRSASTPITTVYQTIYNNLLMGLHTIVLLEYDYYSNFFLKPQDALRSLLQMEDILKQNIFDRDTFVIVASRIGNPDQNILAGRLDDLLRKDFGNPPHTLIIPGELHFTEKEALKILLKLKDDEIIDNSTKVRRMAVSMVNRYVEKARTALKKAMDKCAKRSDERFKLLFENVACYLSDSIRFLNEGKFELAILSVGYAEGLLDSLRFTGQLEIEW
ncbi:MAG: diphthine synthase [Nitrososphaerota archaeon]|nr:diphthine synthase [Nitrososphaerales archaeon]MDW8044378.1 diphthine synthase [Nitrososphaerota archaeon]